MEHRHNIAGIDGCKGGWIVATSDGVLVLSKLRVEGFDFVGIDMPLGLIDGPPRACDVTARKYLGRAGSAVFPAPPRASLSCTDYQAALAAARAATGRGMSKQSFNLMAKMRELDALIDSTNQSIIVEVHPECSFTMLNGGGGLPSKKTPAGQVVRRRLLADHFDVPMAAPPGAAVHDMLDAFAVLWSVRRVERGEHCSFGDGQRDARGIEMRIVC